MLGDFFNEVIGVKPATLLKKKLLRKYFLVNVTSSYLTELLPTAALNILNKKNNLNNKKQD